MSRRKRVETLEQVAGLSGVEGHTPWTAAEFVEWHDATRAEYLRLGYLVETPTGVKRGDSLSHTSHEHGIACLLCAMPDILRHRGLSYPEDLVKFWGDSWTL